MRDTNQEFSSLHLPSKLILGLGKEVLLLKKHHVAILLVAKDEKVLEALLSFNLALVLVEEVMEATELVLILQRLVAMRPLLPIRHALLLQPMLEVAIDCAMHPHLGYLLRVHIVLSEGDDLEAGRVGQEVILEFCLYQKWEIEVCHSLSYYTSANINLFKA